VLAALYLIRQDGVATVRQTSIQIWKALVQNTPRTGSSANTVCMSLMLTQAFKLVREILPEILTQIIFLVSGEEFEQQEVILLVLKML
jgi:hypothetical protein